MTQWLCRLYWLALTAGLLRPHGGDRPSGIAVLDSHPDLSHFLAFMILAILVRAARFRWHPATMMLTLSLYAAGSELAQALVPGRTASPVDALANLLGVFLGAALSSAVARLLKTAPITIDSNQRSRSIHRMPRLAPAVPASQTTPEEPAPPLESTETTPQNHPRSSDF